MRCSHMPDCRAALALAPHPLVLAAPHSTPMMPALALHALVIADARHAPTILVVRSSLPCHATLLYSPATTVAASRSVPPLLSLRPARQPPPLLSIATATITRR